MTRAFGGTCQQQTLKAWRRKLTLDSSINCLRSRVEGDAQCGAIADYGASRLFGWAPRRSSESDGASGFSSPIMVGSSSETVG
jgi:hypothetical protein